MVGQKRDSAGGTGVQRTSSTITPACRQRPRPIAGQRRQAEPLGESQARPVGERQTSIAGRGPQPGDRQTVGRRQRHDPQRIAKHPVGFQATDHPGRRRRAGLTQGPAACPGARGAPRHVARRSARRRPPGRGPGPRACRGPAWLPHGAGPAPEPHAARCHAQRPSPLTIRHLRTRQVAPRACGPFGAWSWPTASGPSGSAVRGVARRFRGPARLVIV